MDKKYKDGVKECLVAKRSKKDKKERGEEVETKEQEKTSGDVKSELKNEDNFEVKEAGTNKNVEEKEETRKYEGSGRSRKNYKRKWNEDREVKHGKYARCDDQPSVARYFGAKDDRRSNDNQHGPKVKSCTLKRQYVRMIREGIKTVEGRTNSTMFHNWKAGDIVKFYCSPDDYVHVKLEKVTKFDSFRDMLVSEGVTNCIPGVYSVEKGVDLYNSIPGYRDKEKRWGVLGFRLKLIPNP